MNKEIEKIVIAINNEWRGNGKFSTDETCAQAIYDEVVKPLIAITNSHQT